jgi:hypothetical protein
MNLLEQEILSTTEAAKKCRLDKHERIDALTFDNQLAHLYAMLIKLRARVNALEK